MSKTQRTKKQLPEEAPLSRIVRIDAIEDGEAYSFEASKSEREAIAALLELPALESLRFAGNFHLEGTRGLLLAGTLSATFTQTCVVSLEPMENTIEAAVEVEFWPEARIEALAKTDDEAASHGILDWPEPIIDGKIEVGRPLFETFATTLDPYPRRDGATFTWAEGPREAEPEGRAESPFAALSRLKTR